MISSEYIEMARKAEEIQDSWEPKEGDLIVNLTKEKYPVLNPIEMLKNMECCRREVVYKNVKEWGVWLPRQEDLQAIAIDYLIKEDKKNGGDPKGWENIFLKDAFSSWWRDEILTSTSLDKLWLAFVMESCYGKRYDTEKKRWVKI